MQADVSSNTEGSFSGAAHEVSSEDVTPVGMDALLSGGMDMQDGAMDDVELKWFGSMQMLTEDIPGLHNKFEGWLIECDESIRTVDFKQGASASPKRGSVDESKSTLDCLFADKEGPVIGCMWDEAASEVLRIRNARLPTDPKPLVQFEIVRIVKMKENAHSGKLLTPMRIMHSV